MTSIARRSRRANRITMRALIAILLLIAAPIVAQPIQVGTSDAVSTTACTLSDALATAQQGASVGACVWGGETTVALDKGGVYALAAPPAPVAQPLTLRGDASAVAPAEIRWATGASGRFFDVAPGGVLTLRNLQLTGGSAFEGGALRVQAGGAADMHGVTFADNHAQYAGGAIDSAGALTIRHATFDGNDAGYAGGAIHSHGAGTVDVGHSLFVDNDGWGGAIYQNGDALSVHSATFSANVGFYGGAIYGKRGSTTVDFSTFRDNQAQAGSAIFMEWGALTLERSALTAAAAHGALCFGGHAITLAGGNVLSDASCGSADANNDVHGAEIAMSPLVHHGGLTQVHVPRCDWTSGRCASPLIDRDDLDLCPAGTIERDQRDQFNRIDAANPLAAHGGSACDVGAYESVCQGSWSDGQNVTVLLHEYQVLDAAPVLLDNGDCFGHPLWDEDADPAAGCSLRWQTYGVRLDVVDIVFLDPQCPASCFPDTALCEAQCTGPSGTAGDDFMPAGWVETARADGSVTIDVDDCSLPILGENDSMRYLIGVRDAQDLSAPVWYWDPKTPVTNDEPPATGGGGGIPGV
ncbi:MAG: hypothetical protein AAF772_02410 [Acidobacteriota bacterium]